MHHVILFVFTEAQHGGTPSGCGMGDARSKAEQQRLHPYSSEILSHLPTRGADKKHTSSVNNYMSCESTAISADISHGSLRSSVIKVETLTEG